MKGEVKSEGKGIASVIVTDGKSFTRTKNNGTFRMDIDDDAEFVYIITPSGHSADRTGGTPQPRSDSHFAQFAGRPLDDLCMTADKLEGTTVGIVLGDICYDVLPLMKRWKEEIVRTGIPFYPAVGNHDKLLDILQGHKTTFMSGHNHINGIFEYAPGIMEHSVAAICGTWWDTYHCTDGTPRGYKVFTKKDMPEPAGVHPNTN